MATQIGEIADRVGWRGTPNHRIAEAGNVDTLPVIDNSQQYSNNVRTSIDCYVSGTYVQRNGKTFEVTQRYTIFIAYNRETQSATMGQVRNRITSDFQAKYGKTFNVSNVFVPQLPVPKEKQFGDLKPGADIPMEMYGGSEMFKVMHPRERYRYDVGTEHRKSSVNIDSLRARYKYKR